MQKRLHLLIALLALVVSTAMAQVTTSGVSGLITASGEDVIGATVTATHTPTGSVYRTVTNSSGRFTIQGMRAGGPYKVEISYLGYKTKEIKNVNLKLGEVADLSAQLEEDAQALGDVVVTGKYGLDASKTGAATSYSSKDIANMPSISHSIGDITRMNPLVSVSQSGAMSFAGINNRYNSFQVDGAVNNDVFGLTSNGQNGGQAGAQPISTETIDQVQVSVAPFDVRQSGFTGGAINAITKSGTNEFHGSVYGNWLNQSLIGSKYTLMNGQDSEKYNDETEYRYGVTIGGPIVKDKLFFFANYEKSNKEYPNNYGYGSSASKLADGDGFKVADEVLSILKSKGYETSFDNPKNYTKSDKAGIKLDWNISDKHKATIGWRMVNAKQLNSNSTASALNASSYQYDFSSKTNTFTAELNSNFSEKVSNQFQASYVSVRDKRDPYGILPMIQISNVGGGTLNLGTERSSTANSLNQDIVTFTDNVNLYLGKHNLTFGTHGEYYKFKNLFIQDNYGTYYFNNFDDFKMFVNGQTLASTTDNYGKVSYYNTLKQYRYGEANVSVTGDRRWAPEFAAGQIGFYAQDKVNITNNFELTYGLRMDIPLFFDTPTANTEFNESAAKQGWGVVTDHKLSSTPMWSPRVGFRWNLEREHNVVLRGGAGIFTGRIPFVWLSNNFTNTGVQTSTYYVNASSGLTEEQMNAGKGNLTNVSFIPDPNGQNANTQNLSASGSQTINVFSKDFKFSQNMRVDLALDFTLAGIDFTVEGLYSKNLNDIYYKDLTRTASGKTVGETYSSLSFDNRPMFTKITSDDDANLKKFGNVYMLDNTSKGYSYSLSLSAVKHFNFGLDVAASYTYSRSKSVNCGTSSVAQSNYNYNYTYQNPNDPELGFTAFNVPHQVKVSAFYHKDYAKHWNTTVGLIYTGSSGSPYSIYYYGDLNGDGSTGNDLFFIPTDAQIDQMDFKATTKYTADQQKENFKQWIAGDSYLSKHRGEYFERYADNEPFESHFDFHFAQTYKFRVGKQIHAVELSFDVLNIGNMFNKKWGRYTSTGSATYYSPVTYSGKGQFQFLHDGDYNMRSYSDYYSRWRGQIGLKYTF